MGIRGSALYDAATTSRLIGNSDPTSGFPQQRHHRVDTSRHSGIKTPIGKNNRPDKQYLCDGSVCTRAGRNGQDESRTHDQDCQEEWLVEVQGNGIGPPEEVDANRHSHPENKAKREDRDKSIVFEGSLRVVHGV